MNEPEFLLNINGKIKKVSKEQIADILWQILPDRTKNIILNHMKGQTKKGRRNDLLT